MSDQFPVFAKLVNKDFQNIVKNTNVFVVNVPELYEKYLSFFPEGTNLIFKTKTEHECSCCRQFIRRTGNVVIIDEHGVVHTVWDSAAEKAPYPYNEVATKLREVVLAASISNLFRISEKENSFGAEKTLSMDKETEKVLTWNHFYTGPIPKKLQEEKLGTVLGDYRTAVQVFERGLIELSPNAVETVVSLIDANNLYRGTEKRALVLEFQKAQQEFLKLGEKRKDLFLWAKASCPAAHFRTDVIGTLVEDLSANVLVKTSDGKERKYPGAKKLKTDAGEVSASDLLKGKFSILEVMDENSKSTLVDILHVSAFEESVETAVNIFEAKVSAGTYKRSTAVITPAMVKQALEKIKELELNEALERRFAVIGDIARNDVLWADAASRNLMKGNLEDALMQHAFAVNPKSNEEDEKRAEVISLDDFVSKILPETTSMELLLKSEHLGNLMSLTAPVHKEPKQLFKWNNDFAWSYSGNITDSIKERVKKAGGKVEGTLRVSLSWFNHDDLDLHIFEPNGRGANVLNEICYRNKKGWTGGVLDVDMNVSPTTREPVENVIWAQKVPDGAYKVVVNNFTQREMSNVGFVIQIENAGKLSHYSYNKAVRAKQDVHVVTLHVKNGVVERYEDGDSGITAQNLSQDKWGLRTEQYVKVSVVTLSPNYWGENAVGNKHTFFILDGCKNDEATRGIYNEFLNSRLEPHRKVFEVIGDKTKCQPTDGQLSGVGFSSTKKDSVVIKVQQGKRRRLFNVNIVA